MKNINMLLSVGSVDGVCTSAALLRYLGSEKKIGLEFCQAFTVDKVDPTKWESNRKVALVDLAVNNRAPEMTVDFLRRLNAAGHTIIGVLDEHNAEDWKKAFAATELSFDDLAIKPVSQDAGDIKSSGALLLSLLGNEADEQTKELCQAADAGDRMDFSTHFGGLVNQAVKSRIADDSRRVYLARHFAANAEPDEKISGWITEYETILANHDKIVAAGVDLGDGIWRGSAIGVAVDMTTLMGRLYQDYSLVLLEGEMFDKSAGKKVQQIAFGCKPGLKIDVLAVLKAAGVDCSGFAAKANVKPENEEAALAAVRAALTE